MNAGSRQARYNKQPADVCPDLNAGPCIYIKFDWVVHYNSHLLIRRCWYQKKANYFQNETITNCTSYNPIHSCETNLSEILSFLIIAFQNIEQNFYRKSNSFFIIMMIGSLSCLAKVTLLTFLKSEISQNIKYEALKWPKR